jgi:hypothetical protein
MEPENDLPDFNGFIAWSKDFGLDVGSWTSNNAVQFWTFFRHGWQARTLEETMKPLFDENAPQIDVAQLRQLTEKAIQRGKEKETKRLADVQAKNERQAKADQLLAAKVLAEVPDKCEREAGRERSHAIVMGLKWGRDYGHSGPGSTNSLSQSQLKGPALIVWDYLQEQKLNPTLEYWHDGLGMNSGFNIVVKW